MEKEPKIKDWSEVTITNQFMFNKVFTSNPEACKRLLEILPHGRGKRAKREYSVCRLKGRCTEYSR